LLGLGNEGLAALGEGREAVDGPPFPILLVGIN
jgi:hypothetical protein